MKPSIALALVLSLLSPYPAQAQFAVRLARVPAASAWAPAALAPAAATPALGAAAAAAAGSSLASVPGAALSASPSAAGSLRAAAARYGDLSAESAGGDALKASSGRLFDLSAQAPEGETPAPAAADGGDAPARFDPSLVPQYVDALKRSTQGSGIVGQRTLRQVEETVGVTPETGIAIFKSLVAEGMAAKITPGAYLFLPLARETLKNGDEPLTRRMVGAIKRMSSDELRDKLIAIGELGSVEDAFWQRDLRHLQADAELYRKNAIVSTLRAMARKVAADAGPDRLVKDTADAAASTLDKFVFGQNHSPTPLDEATKDWLEDHVNSLLEGSASLSGEEPVRDALKDVQDFLKNAHKPLGGALVPAKPADKPKADPKPKRAVPSYGPAAELERKMDQLGVPEHIRAVAQGILDDIAQSRGDKETNQTRLKWLLDLPWSKRDPEQIDIAASRRILDRDHYGLEGVKKDVLEFLEARRTSGNKKGAIILFEGPPGVGKTSIAKSIAEAMGRTFVKLSLGGTSNATALKGHERTFKASEPGFIVQKMVEAKVMNPVFLLDEVEKLGKGGAHGDPSATLLEILDPEQNERFQDDYLGVPYDLSEVVFIATANDLSAIPEPLRDRLEIVKFTAYTSEEKVQIAKRHFVPEMWKEFGLREGRPAITDEALRRIVDGWSVEAGVRTLRRKVRGVARKIAAWELPHVGKGRPSPKNIDAALIDELLGKARKSSEDKMDNGIGLANGLAVAGGRGSLLPVEVAAFPGAGRTVVTGSLRDVMKESVAVAKSMLQARAKELKIPDDFFKKNDLHIHFPAGAIPKDGPSAGITIATAILSEALHKPVRADVAMTGEMSLKGRVLPIGGLGAKSMAAYNNGFTLVLHPIGNADDVDEIPKSVREGLTLLAVRTFEEVAAIVFAEPGTAPAPGGGAARTSELRASPVENR